MGEITTIFGPPGTGKTTRLLDIIAMEMKSGVQPDKIAFCSFTKKATEEAIDRTVDRFDFKKNDLIYFKSIHSLAFHSLGMRKSQVMQARDYAFIGAQLGLSFKGAVMEHPTRIPLTKYTGDMYAFIYGFARARCMNPVDVWYNIDTVGLNWHEFQRYVDAVKEYKEHKGLYDFSDMLENNSAVVPVDVLIIDEAQDLSTAQWQFLWPTMQAAKRVYVGGDDDQSIFAWGGADITKFLSLPGKKEILTQSYRLPKTVFDFANTISAKIQQRQKKDYHPNGEQGSVTHWNYFDYIDMSSGTWLLLARNGYLLNRYAELLKDKGLVYSMKNNSVINKEHIKAIRLWERWRETGERLKSHHIELIHQYLPRTRDKWDRTKIWHEAFTRMDMLEKEYYISLLRRGESLVNKPRIIINTIHGSKGGEADNVVLLTDMAATAFHGSNLDHDAEHRVWYVGATRAKQNLHIVASEGRYGYQV